MFFPTNPPKPNSHITNMFSAPNVCKGQYEPALKLATALNDERMVDDLACAELQCTHSPANTKQNTFQFN